MTNGIGIDDRHHYIPHPQAGTIRQALLQTIRDNLIAKDSQKQGLMDIINAPLLQQVTEKLHAEGGRMTAQRRHILEVLESYPDHPTAEEIYLRARESDESLHLSTVYRTLRWLEEEGFVSPRWFEDERRQERFDMGSGGSLDHHHFRCQICNQIIEFSDPLIEQIKASYQEQNGGSVESATLTLYGVCAACEAAKQIE